MSAEFIESRRQSANPGFPSKLPLKWCVCVWIFCIGNENNSMLVIVAVFSYLRIWKIRLFVICCCTWSPLKKSASELKLEHSGEGPFLNVVPRCQFYKLPHKVHSLNSLETVKIALQINAHGSIFCSCNWLVTNLFNCIVTDRTSYQQPYFHVYWEYE